MTASQNRKNEHDEKVPLYGISQKMVSKRYSQILNLKDRQELFHAFYRPENWDRS